MNIFPIGLAGERPESAENSTFSAMRALVDRLAVTEAGAAASERAGVGRRMGEAKHTASAEYWINGIVPNAGGKIP